MTRQALILEMAAAIWRDQIGGVGRAPKAIVEAAGELADLYELANHEGVLDVAHRLRRAGGGVDIGECLVQLAIGEAPDSYVDAAARADISVPTFTVEVERRGDDIEVGWEGGAEPRGGIHPNPVKRNAGEATVLLLEDEPALQKSTTRMIKKIIPGAHVVVSDNVDGMIGNLRFLEPVLIVSDVDVIGDKSGIDFFHYVRDNYPQYVDRFLFFTGNEDAKDENARFLAKPAGIQAFREAVLSPSPAPAPAPVRRARPDPAALAAIVRSVMPTIRAETDPDGRWRGRFGDRKVFISAIWRVLANDPRMGGMAFPEFKHELTKAHRARQLVLARADLVAAMNPNEVAESETYDDIATYHFVVDTPVAPPSPPPVPRTIVATASPHSIGDLAQAVLSVLPSVRERKGPSGRAMGRYGSDKVFIAAVWRALRGMPGYQGLSLEDFKKQLLVANREQLLNLSRADLVDDMDPDEVELSEIQDAFGSLHFIDEPGEQLGRPVWR
jgi:hypothetical protein